MRLCALYEQPNGFMALELKHSKMQNNESRMKTRFQTTDQAWSKSQFGIMHFFGGENSLHFHSTCIFTERHVLLFTTLLIQCSNKRFAAWEIHYEFSSHHVQKLASSIHSQWKLRPISEAFILPNTLSKTTNKMIRCDLLHYRLFNKKSTHQQMTR